MFIREHERMYISDTELKLCSCKYNVKARCYNCGNSAKLLHVSVLSSVGSRLNNTIIHSSLHFTIGAYRYSHKAIYGNSI